jgi:hypothetical protein
MEKNNFLMTNKYICGLCLVRARAARSNPVEISKHNFSLRFTFDLLPEGDFGTSQQTTLKICIITNSILNDVRLLVDVVHFYSNKRPVPF